MRRHDWLPTTGSRTLLGHRMPSSLSNLTSLHIYTFRIGKMLTQRAELNLFGRLTPCSAAVNSRSTTPLRYSTVHGLFRQDHSYSSLDLLCEMKLVVTSVRSVLQNSVTRAYGELISCRRMYMACGWCKFWLKTTR